MLLALKQGAEIERRGTVKGKKDAIDILTLLIHSKIDLKKYWDLLARNEKESHIDKLAEVLQQFSDKDIPHLGIDFTGYKKWKKALLAELKKL